MITTREIDFLKAQEQFESICQFILEASEQGQRVDQVERGLFPQAMLMCLQLLRAFVEVHGDGDQGKEIEQEDRTLRRLDEPRDKRYLSIFGELIISRYVTARAKDKRSNGCRWTRPSVCPRATTPTCWKTGSNACA